MKFFIQGRNMKNKFLYVILISFSLTNCAFLKLLSRNQSPQFQPAFIPTNHAKMVDYKDLTLSWECFDPENDNLYYDLFLAKVDEPLKQITNRQKESRYQLFFPLESEIFYKWFIRVSDGKNVVDSDTLFFKTKYYFPQWWGEQNSSHYLYYFGVGTHDFQKISFTLASENAEDNKIDMLSEVVQKDIQIYLEEAGINDKKLIQMANNVVQVVCAFNFDDVEYDLQETKRTKEGYYRTYIRAAITSRQYKRKLVSVIRKARPLYEELKYSLQFRKLDDSV